MKENISWFEITKLILKHMWKRKLYIFDMVAVFCFRMYILMAVMVTLSSGWFTNLLILIFGLWWAMLRFAPFDIFYDLNFWKYVFRKDTSKVSKVKEK